jgi:hypothetical protein
MINFHFRYPTHLMSWLNKDWHLEICDYSWLAWFLILNIHLPSHPVPRRQDSRLLFSDAWFIVSKSMLILLQLPSCLTYHFISSIESFLKNFFIRSSCFYRYPLRRSSTWSILSWLWASHKCWTKLIFIFSCSCVFLAWLDIFFNMELFVGLLYMLITYFHLLHNCTSRDVSMNTFVLFI